MSGHSLNAHTDYEKKMLLQDSKIHNLGSFKKVWVIGAVRGKASLFEKVCEKITKKFTALDRLVFTGNLLGSNLDDTNESSRVIDIALKLRSKFMCNKFFDISDIVFLRGYSEELLEKSIELHMSPNPLELVEWMYSKGLDQILKSYNIQDNLLDNAARNGAAALSRASSEIRLAINKKPGHTNYLSSLKRLAFNEEKTLLFVSAGLSKDRPIEAQSDELWWGGGFSDLDDPYNDMLRLVRGHDPKQNGITSGKYGVTLDGGNDTICAGLFQSDGQLIETIQS